MTKDLLNIGFTSFLMLVFGFAVFGALQFSRLAQFFPLYVSIAGTVCTAIYLVVLIIRYRKENASSSRAVVSIARPLRYMAWLLGYIAFIYLVGMLIATSLFLVAFLMFESKMPFIKTALSVAIVLIGISAASSLLGVYWPTNLLGL
ncbi:tripartite tricarboxylate transporter TctB family protein [Shouchella clausii]|jgi:hypothetical protein|uniref:DUF1468 domain-containing protein n=3 Tax=Shouchella TaxID=2893057 RepID=Q5WKE2_SHOC1|nr:MULTISPECIES: tripartite tricarboxylate transporter TctB family protein [Shouchella]MCM3314433.1 tripartite tricarboxylate transporter TctB family protein [Psychrobacillus sp. MER TA 17]ALA52232.1 Tricarboxylate transport protein TctB [Shouchella clausii]KKI86834.1 hypothetical protein WZ76_07830 [Shouchella clausii]MBU3230331.1 tripartite tricarboxylate transporter TctB family protein [Shouchella clausii]MBU3262470.1 tripartite tricarboxylate transporter TctB family protein [Shouchella cla